MAGPTTEVLNEDVRDLRGDFREIRGHLDSFKSEIFVDVRRIDLGLTRVQTEFSFAKWLLGSLLVAAVTGISTGIWWAATISANVRNLEISTNDRINRLESSANDRFGRLESSVKNLEASIAKVLEQTRPKP